jgi:hypothetical protein
VDGDLVTVLAVIHGARHDRVAEARTKCVNMPAQ